MFGNLNIQVMSLIMQHLSLLDQLIIRYGCPLNLELIFFNFILNQIKYSMKFIEPALCRGYPQAILILHFARHNLEECGWVARQEL